MKRIPKQRLILFFLLLFPESLLAQEDLNQGVFKQIIRENYQDFEGSKKLFDPDFSGQFVGDLDFTNNYKTTNNKDEYKNSFVKGRLYSKFAINKNFSVNSLLRLEQVETASEARKYDNSSRARDNYFRNEALFIQEITLNYNNKNTTLLAGKFTPNFATAWRWGRGIWANELVKNYKETEKLGFGGVYKIGDLKKTGQYNFGFSTFTNDRNNFDNSLITNRDSESKSDAVPGDTKSLKSYTASVDILFDFNEKEKLSYHFSYINLAVNSRASSVSLAKIADQKGFAVGMNYRYPFDKNFLLDALLEYVDMKNIGGNSDINDRYSTASLVGEIYQNWNITLATTNLVRKQLSQNGYDQNLAEISAGYKFNKTEFFDDLLLQIGYKNLRTNYKTSLTTDNSYGVLLRYIKAF